MSKFHFRLEKVLDWYRKQCQIEEQRLRMCSDRVLQTQAEIERHQQEVLARQMELIECPMPDTAELAALGPFRRGARGQEKLLRQKLRTYEQELVRQRGVAQLARRRQRLVENLRERRLSEHQYEADREMEELASETHLAGLVRALNAKATI
jgi:glucose-6-phosphate dehydrogenase assembly protein OpcA